MGLQDSLKYGSLASTPPAVDWSSVLGDWWRYNPVVDNPVTNFLSDSIINGLLSDPVTYNTPPPTSLGMAKNIPLLANIALRLDAANSGNTPEQAPTGQVENWAGVPATYPTQEQPQAQPKPSSLLQQYLQLSSADTTVPQYGKAVTPDYSSLYPDILANVPQGKGEDRLPPLQKLQAPNAYPQELLDKYLEMMQQSAPKEVKPQNEWLALLQGLTQGSLQGNSLLEALGGAGAQGLGNYMKAGQYNQELQNRFNEANQQHALRMAEAQLKVGDVGYQSQEKQRQFANEQALREEDRGYKALNFDLANEAEVRQQVDKVNSLKADALKNAAATENENERRKFENRAIQLDYQLKSLNAQSDFLRSQAYAKQQEGAGTGSLSDYATLINKLPEAGRAAMMEPVLFALAQQLGTRDAYVNAAAMSIANDPLLRSEFLGADYDKKLGRNPGMISTPDQEKANLERDAAEIRKILQSGNWKEFAQRIPPGRSLFLDYMLSSSGR